MAGHGDYDSLYDTLDAAKRQIRFLTISPASSDTEEADELRCSLVTEPLDDSVAFDALSYTWGDQKDALPIVVNGIIISITRNLYDALKACRNVDDLQGKYLWADALCINQGSDLERNQQVQMMGSIYSKAKVVRIWLGHCTAGTDRAMALLKRISSDEAAPSTANLWNLGVDTLEALSEFFSRPWFDRLWVLQEAALAQQPLLFCDNRALPFRSNILKAFYKIAEGSVRGYVPTDPALQASKMHFIGRILGRLWHFQFADDILTRQDITDRDIVNLLGKANACKAKVAHDRIIGLLGLLPASIGIVPNYKATMQEMFEHATRQIINWTHSLYILHLTGLSKRHDVILYTAQASEEEPDMTLPTWVPEFRALWRGGFLPHGTFDACAGRSFTPQRGALVKSELHCLAKHIGKVQGCDSILDSPFRSEPLAAHKETFQRWRQMLIAEKNEQRDECAFWRTVTDGAVWREGDARQWTEENSFEYVKQYEDWLYSTASPQLPEFLSGSLVEGQRSFFTLDDKSKFGTSRGCVEPGDVVAILNGFSWPVVLRPKGGSKHQLVSSCYIDGLMFGQLFHKTEVPADDVTTDADEFHQISLV